MVLYWGEDLFTNVDNARGVFVVRTKFIHMYGMPLLPVQSFLCVRQENPRRRAGAGLGGSPDELLHYATVNLQPRKQIVSYLPIPTNGKSLVAAYAHVGAIFAGIIAIRAAVAVVIEPSWSAARTGAEAALIALGLFLIPRHRWIRNASYGRALLLAEQAMANEGLLNRIDAEYAC